MLVFPATSHRPDAYVAAARELEIDLVVATDLVATATRFGCPAVEVDFANPLRVPDMPPVDGVLAVDEGSALVAASIAANGPCEGPYHTIEGVRAARDKGEMRAALHRAGVPNPTVRARVARGGSIPDVPFPCVVKPPRLSGSQGVIRADDPASLARAISRTRRILHRHRRARGADEAFFEIVVEDYVQGAEVAVEGLMSGGGLEPIAIFDKPVPMCGPFFEESIYVTPSVQPIGVRQALHRVTEQAANALGLTDGPVHAELRVSDGGPELIEIAARSIGGLCSRALHHVVGSLERLLLRHAIGEPLVELPTSGKASGVMMVPVPRSGVLRRVDGGDVARACPGVDAFTMGTRVGEIVRRAPDGDSYLGFIFAHGDDTETATRNLRRAHAELSFELTPLLDVWP